jgi:hypothetical protein
VLAANPPRFIRLRDPPTYLGMDKNRFNREVRPQLCMIPIGTEFVFTCEGQPITKIYIPGTGDWIADRGFG